MSDELSEKGQRETHEREGQERQRREQIRASNLRDIAAYGSHSEQPMGSLGGDGGASEQSKLPTAFERVEDFFSIDFRAETDSRLFAYGADRCGHLAGLLDRQIAHLERHEATRYYALHLQGDLGEHAVVAQWEGAGQAENLNNPAKLHDNHLGTDVRVDTEDHGQIFEADAKVSLRSSPEDYYLKKLAQFEAKVRENTLDSSEAHLFVPEDQVQLTRDAIDRRFERVAEREPERAAELREEAERWKNRVHDGPLTSGTHEFVLRHCRDNSDSRYIALEELRALRDDLRTTEDYLRQQGRRIEQSS